MGCLGFREVSVDGRAGDAELGGYLGDGVGTLPGGVGFVVHSLGERDLAWSELWALAAGAAPGSSCGEAVPGPFGHERVLKLSDGPDDGEEQSTNGGGSVDALVEHNQVNLLVLQLLRQVNQVRQRATEPVQFGDHELIARPVGREQCLVQLGSPGEGPGGVIDEDRLTAARYDALSVDLLGPVLHKPAHPLLLARFGTPALLPATMLLRALQTDQGRALFAGAAAHSMRPFTEPLSSAIGLGLLTAGHHNGWPVVRGGTQTLTNALLAGLQEIGGLVETGVCIRNATDLPPADVVLLDLTPRSVARIFGSRLPARTLRLYERAVPGSAVFKVDFAVEGGIPWRDEAVRLAGTVHLGGYAAEVAHSEGAIASGRMPMSPFVLVAQQYVADPERSRGGLHPVYSYAHVPAGYDGDATEVITDRIERFAPGFRDRIIESHTTSPAALSSSNANLAGGDILSGATSPAAVSLGPRRGQNPYRTGIPGMYLCSAAAPPGPGAHGMAGYNAARLALRDLADALKIPSEARTSEASKRVNLKHLRQIR